jgi:hypothetical protein
LTTKCFNIVSEWPRMKQSLQDGTGR